ncbi:hypothetical protein [Pasteuria penetrans]|uniref:hypothetical protein n=1 Tax=Pasteuria penetrans TaxID=86005 RepID=UPI000FA116AA|nr:hypothetical protein [Pasteuria penetrans]
MGQSGNGEGVVLVTLLLAAGYGIACRFRKWFLRYQKYWLQKQERSLGPPPTGEIPTLLREHGFEVVHGGERWPVRITVDGSEYESSVQIDYLAKRGDGWYIVMVASGHRKFRLHGSALRDRFFAPQLLWGPLGILYVEPEFSRVRMICVRGPRNVRPVQQSLRGVHIAVGFCVLLLCWSLWQRVV